MYQRRSLRTAPRIRSLAVGGALAAFAVVGGGAVVAVTATDTVAAGDVRLTQNDASHEMVVGTPVSLDLEPIVARAAGGSVPPGTTVKVTGLPDGLAQDGWVISGAPTRAGTYDVLVTVANGQLTKSQTVSVTVTDGTGEAATTGGGTTTTTGEGATGGEAGAGESPAGDDATGEGGTGTGDETGTGTGTGTGGEAGAGTGDGTGTTVPDLCAVLGGGEGANAGSSASGLTALLGEKGESVPTGLVTVLADALARMLPSLLGDTGSLSEAVCTLQPLLSGSGAGATAGGTTGGGADAGAGTEAAAGAGAGLTGAPAALLGLLGTGAGSLDG